MFLTIYIIGFAVTCYIIHRNNIKIECDNRERNLAHDDRRRKKVEDPGSIIMLGVFWPLVCVAEGLGWVADSSRNGYKDYVESQATKLEVGEQENTDSIPELEARLEALINAQLDDENSI